MKRGFSCFVLQFAVALALFGVTLSSTHAALVNVALIDDDTLNLGVDTLIRNFVRDSLKPRIAGDVFSIKLLDDGQAHGKRTNQAWWKDTMQIQFAIWTSSSFGGNDIAPIQIPVLLLNRNHVAVYGLGSASNTASAGKLLLNLRNDWITSRLPSDTVYAIQGANLAFGQALGANRNGLKPILRAPGAAGIDTAAVVVVDSNGLLYDGVALAACRRGFLGIGGSPNLWTWSHGWHTVFSRVFYRVYGDTANAVVRNKAKICDRWGSRSTWFELGSCHKATVSNSSTIRPGFGPPNAGHNGHMGGLICYDSLKGYLGTPPANSLLVVDSVDYDMHLTTANAYNLDAPGDSTFNYRLYIARILRRVPFNEGSSTYNGATCGVNDTAGSSNHWVNRWTPAYPSDWNNRGSGDNLTDSVWKIEAARGVGTDIEAWAAGDTVRVNKTATPPGSWTDFPTQASWFQKWYDDSLNTGFAIGQDVITDSSDCELNYRSRAELPTTDNAPRLTVWFHYAPQSQSARRYPRRRVITQTLSVNPELLRQWGFAWDGAFWRDEMMGFSVYGGPSETLTLSVSDWTATHDIDHNGAVDIADLTLLAAQLFNTPASEREYLRIEEEK